MIPGVLRLQNPLSAVVWLAVFVPGHLLGGRLGLLFPVAVSILGGVILFTQPSPWESRRPARQAAAIFILLALLDAVSCAYSTAFNGIRAGPGDLWSLSRHLMTGLFVVYLIRHHDASVRKSLASALTAAVYLTLFLRSLGVRSWSLFEPAQSLGYLSALAAIHFLFFSRVPLRRVHAAASVLVMYFHASQVFGSSREALSYLWRSPVFGWGPALYEPMSALGNQYLRWMLRSGVLGTGLILVGLGLVSFRLLRAAWDDRTHRIGVGVFLGAAALMFLAGAFLEDFRLLALTAFLIAGIHEDVR